MILSSEQQMENENTCESEYDSGEKDLDGQRSCKYRLAIEDGVGIIAPGWGSVSLSSSSSSAVTEGSHIFPFGSKVPVANT